jgi:hypothetical protein
VGSTAAIGGSDRADLSGVLSPLWAFSAAISAGWTSNGESILSIAGPSTPLDVVFAIIASDTRAQPPDNIDNPNRPGSPLAKLTKHLT